MISTTAAYKFQKSKHYYTIMSRHEQSLDVYRPIIPNDSCDDRPILVLVMGSGWIGHSPWIYALTNWWNAQLPCSICGKLCYKCITIRHSGGFFHPKTMAIQTLLMSVIKPDYLYLWLIAWLILFWQGQGAATMDDMLKDVATAFHYIFENSKQLGFGDDCKFVVGGYSSGAHLAATYFNTQEKIVNERLSGILYLSGMLSLDCWALNIITLVVLGKWTWELPSPFKTIVKSQQKAVPHLLIGCRHEFFGLPILDRAFPSIEYAEKVQQGNRLSRCILVPSNHWTMLSSDVLTHALEEHLPLVFSASVKPLDHVIE